ncbi:MAG: succinate dehydrogenase, hydrophobic membrane anchor protein [Candidatus Eisenbacteria bacterium]|nr:succinate dehydrogenase, hydrophobic membrane anchor protein [Candidatus Eisenbacteria bacterium]
MQRERGVRSGGLLAWFFQRLTGIVLAPILLVHLFTMHRYHEHGLAFENVTRLFANPYWKVLETVFLVAALYHGLLGIHFVLQDYIKRPGLRLTIFSLIVIAGVILVAFGLVTVFTVRASAGH